MATLLSRQKPWEPWGSLAQVTTPVGPAWCPGGRTAQKALSACSKDVERLSGGRSQKVRPVHRQRSGGLLFVSGGRVCGRS